MKNVVIGIICCILSLIITFVLFEMLSWYHFGDIPTKIVIIRFVIAFLFLSLLTNLLTFAILKKRKD